MLGFGREKPRAHLDTTTGTQPSGCRGVSIAPCCSVNAAFLFAEPRMLVVVSRCAPLHPQGVFKNGSRRGGASANDEARMTNAKGIPKSKCPMERNNS